MPLRRNHTANLLLSSVGLLAALVLITATVTEARASRGVLSLPSDAWTATSDAAKKTKEQLIKAPLDKLQHQISKVSGAWVVGVGCAVRIKCPFVPGFEEP